MISESRRCRPEWIDIPSKIGQIAMACTVRDMARMRPERGILVNAACPGLIDTDALRPWLDEMSKAPITRSNGKADRRPVARSLR